MSDDTVIDEPTEAEAQALERARASQNKVVRPTPPPFPWARQFTTVGITGTNGKTSTTRLVAAALEGPARPVLSETTIGYEFRGEPVKVPRTLQGFYGALARAARLGARHAAIETTSQALGRGYAKLWRFDVGVFTNLSHDHLSQHGSWEHYLASKAQLFVHLGPGATGVLNAADPCAELIHRVMPSDVKRLWYGVNTRGAFVVPPALAAAHVEVTQGGTRVELADNALAESFGGELTTQLIGAVFAENLLAAACAAHAAGIPPREIAANLAACAPPRGRFQVVHRDPLVVVDYAHTPDALARTCETGRTLAGKNRLIIVFGAGGGRDKDKRGPMGRAVGERADQAIVTTDNPRHEDPSVIARALLEGCRQGGRAAVTLISDRREAILAAVQGARPGDCVLVTGKGHELDQEIGSVKVPFDDVEVIRAAFGR
jgi:UDP-N-acetylmuramoyl-L-alanyl-D-glutamate--2,6-diaminopimelate ligase